MFLCVIKDEGNERIEEMKNTIEPLGLMQQAVLLNKMTCHFK